MGGPPEAVFVVETAVVGERRTASPGATFMNIRTALFCLAPLAACACAPETSEPVIANDPALEARAAQIDALSAPPATSAPVVYFANLADGDIVTSPFRVVFGISGLGVAPALTDKEMTGHHHLFIDTELTAEEMEYAIPNDDTHRHFGGGQTEVVLDLPPGAHTLQLNFGDLNHEQFDPPVLSEKITITVE